MNEPIPSFALRPLTDKASRILCAVAVAVGVLVLLGWLINHDTLKRIIPGLVAMNPLTALCFIASGTALWLLSDQTASANRSKYRIAQLLAVAVLLVGFTKLLEIVTGANIGVDRLLFHDKLDAEAALGLPNRMAPNTALNFLLLGLALLLLDVSWGRAWPAQFIAIIGTAFSLLALVGYAYGNQMFYGVGSFIPMALHTAVAFVMLLMAVLLARSQRGLMATISSQSAGGSMARLLLPAAIVIPFLLGWLRAVGENAGLYNTDVGLSLFVVLNMLTFATLVWWNASALYETDMERRATAEQLENSHAELSKRNAEMEADLNLAREIQQAFLPQQFLSFPRSLGPMNGALQFHHRYQPTSTLGGDFTDILVLSETRAGVFICDVMGHGVRSALVTAVARGLIEELLPTAVDPGRFLTQLNHSLIAILKRTHTPMFASAFFMITDVETGQMHFANAGHPSPLHLQREARVVEWLQNASLGAGPALGLIDDFQYTSYQCPLAERDLIMLFTDGLVEVMHDEDEYGEDRLLDAVKRQLNLPASSLFDALIGEIQDFADHKGFEDDVCLVGMEVARLETLRDSTALKKAAELSGEVNKGRVKPVTLPLT